MTDLRKINTVISKHIIKVRLLKINEHEKELRLSVYNEIKNEINIHLDTKYYNISNLLIWLVTYRNLMINNYKQIKDIDYLTKAYMISETLQEILSLELQYIKEEV